MSCDLSVKTADHFLLTRGQAVSFALLQSNEETVLITLVA